MAMQIHVSQSVAKRHETGHIFVTHSFVRITTKPGTNAAGKSDWSVTIISLTALGNYDTITKSTGEAARNKLVLHYTT